MFFTFFFLNGEGADPGTPDTAVDEQRNRISATSAMKRAQTMADQGVHHGICQCCQIRMFSIVQLKALHNFVPNACKFPNYTIRGSNKQG